MPEDLTGALGSAPPAAPTAPSAPAPVSAERAASDAGDFGAFDRAHTAKKQGKSVPAVTPEAAPRREVAEADAPEAEAPAGTPPGERPVSRRQQAINDYERRIATQEQRIRDLESRMARPSDAGSPPPVQPPQAPPQETQKQRVARYLALPDAPKVDDFDTYPEFGAAQTLFLQDKLRAEDQAVRGRQQQQEHRLHAMAARDQSFRERLTAAKDADPSFVTGLSEEAKSLGGIDHALRSGRQPGPVNIIGELVYDSPHAVAFLRHISSDPQALAALVTPPEHIQRLPPQWRAKAHIDHLVTEFRRLEGRLAYEESQAARDDAPMPASSVSTAPPPPPTLGKAGRSTDPVRSALARNDFEAFDQAEQAKRAARRAGRAG